MHDVTAIVHNGGNVMNKLIATIIVGLPLLAATSLADANGWGNGGVRASISIGVPIGNYGYAAVSTGPVYYPAPVYYPTQAYYPAPVYYPAPYYYAPRPVYYGRGYGPEYGSNRKHGKKNHSHYDQKRGYNNGYGYGN